MASSYSKSPSRNPVVVKAAIGKSRICEALREALPSYDEIIATLARNGAWWDSFRQKTRAISQAEPVEPLLSFGAHAYTSTSPAELGILAVAYARSLGRNHRLFALVDSLIIADSTLTATLEGMECLILLAKSYTDVGQPRRSWLTWRRGLAVALLMVRVGINGSHPTELTTANRDYTASVQTLLPYGNEYGWRFITATALPACFLASPTDSTTPTLTYQQRLVS
jgi:hypothetical protein